MAGPDSTATYNQEQRERLGSEMMDLVKKGKQTPESLLKHFLDKGYARREISRALLDMIAPDENGVRKCKVDTSWYLTPVK